MEPFVVPKGWQNVATGLRGCEGWLRLRKLQLDGGLSLLYTIDRFADSANFGNAILVGDGVIGDGSTIRDFTIIPVNANAVTEPSSAAVLILALGTFCVRRKPAEALVV